MSIVRDGSQSADLDAPVTSPTLNLDFANSQSLDPRITFTRGSIGTRVNRNGLIETIPANQPRFDYDPISGECRGLLIEESRQNLLTYSEDFSDASWFKGGTLITSNIITSPSNELTGDLFEVTSSGGSKYIAKDAVTVNGTTYTASIFAKSANSTTFSMGLFTAAFVGLYRFNLTGAGSVTTQIAGVSASITQYSNGWYKCSVTATTNAVATTLLIYPNTTVNTISNSIYIWGVQVEAGAFPTSYIPTTASTVTRSADTATMTGTNFSSWYNSTEGTLYANLRAAPFPTNSFSRFFSLNDGTVNNVLSVYARGANNGFDVVRSVGTTQQFFTGASVSSVYNSNKVALGFNQSSFSISANGSSLTNYKTLSSSLSVNRLLIFSEWYGGTTSGTISRLTYYPKRLSDAQLQYLTQ